MVLAYAALRRTMDAVPRLVLAGRDDLSPSVRALIRRLGLQEHVTVEQNVPTAGLPDLYRRASVFLQTSYEEGLGISVLEAMASGIPALRGQAW